MSAHDLEEEDFDWDQAPPKPEIDPDGSLAAEMRRSVSLPKAVPKKKLRELVEQIDDGKMTLDDAVRELDIDADTLHRYYRAHSREKDDDETTGQANSTGLRREVSHELRETYSENWERNAEMFEPEVIKPTLLARVLSLTPLTRWMVRDSRVVLTSLTGVITLLLLGGIAAIAIATNTNEVEHLENPEPTELSPSQLTDAAEKAIRDFLSGDGWEAKAKFVRDAETNAPHMEEWVKSDAFVDDEHYDFLFFEEMLEQNGRRFLRFSGYNDINDPAREIFVDCTVEPFKVDWQAFAGWQPMDWETFLKERPDGVFPFRVVATLSEYRNYEFRDDAIWLSLELRPPTTGTMIHAFVDRRTYLGSEIAHIFLTQSLEASTEVTVLLGLSFDKERPEQDLIFIESVINPNWISP